MNGFWSEGFFFPNPGCGPTVRTHLKRTKAQWPLHAPSFLPDFSQDRGDRTLRLSQKVQDKGFRKDHIATQHVHKYTHGKRCQDKELNIQFAAHRCRKLQPLLRVTLQAQELLNAFWQKQNRYHPIAYKGKTEPTTVAERYGKLSPTNAPGNKKESS